MYSHFWATHRTNLWDQYLQLKKKKYKKRRKEEDSFLCLAFALILTVPCAQTPRSNSWVMEKKMLILTQRDPLGRVWPQSCKSHTRRWNTSMMHPCHCTHRDWLSSLKAVTAPTKMFGEQNAGNSQLRQIWGEKDWAAILAEIQLQDALWIKSMTLNT